MGVRITCFCQHDIGYVALYRANTVDWFILFFSHELHGSDVTSIYMQITLQPYNESEVGYP